MTLFSLLLQLRSIQIRSNPLSTYNQQLWLTCVVELEPSEGMHLMFGWLLVFSANSLSESWKDWAHAGRYV